MTKWAHVENNEIKGVYDRLPISWKNVSGFNMLADNLEVLKTFNWLPVSEYESYDAERYNEIGYTYSIVNSRVIASPILQLKTIISYSESVSNELREIRIQRDKLLAESDVYQLGDWQKVFDESLKLRWLLYRAALRDVPETYLSKGVLSWPTGLESLVSDSKTSMTSYLSGLSDNTGLEEPL